MSYHYYDDATGEPSNTCCACSKEVIGWVDTPYEDFYCEECEEADTDDEKYD
jgi:hypothetical protein